MRVVAGRLGGRRIASPPGRSRAVRPTSDRARETLFALLGDVSDLLVLDLFCGTGALAIEALSRAADAAVLVDTDLEVAQRNVEALGLAERTELVRSDALRHLRRDDGEYDLVFCDPPYGLADRLGPQLDPLIPPRLSETGRVIVESDARNPLELTLPVLVERGYGDTMIRVHTGPQR
jgi:16S rRNA (guanine966-N2)-methyltransferase